MVRATIAVSSTISNPGITEIILPDHTMTWQQVWGHPPDIYNLVTETPLIYGPGGNIWVTGHDTDYHCAVELNSCHYLQIALTYVMNGSSLPVLALDHGSEVATAISNAFPSNAPSVV